MPTFWFCTVAKKGFMDHISIQHCGLPAMKFQNLIWFHTLHNYTECEAQPSQDGVVDEGISSEVSHNKLHPTGMGEEGAEEECCGFCLQKLTYMIEPNQLPCSHIFCLPCLQEDPKKDCPVCGWVRDHVYVWEGCKHHQSHPVNYSRLCNVCKSETTIKR